jgi:hypothetical protein
MLLEDVAALTRRLPLPRQLSLSALHPVAHPWRLTSLVAAFACVAVTGSQLIAANAPHASALVSAAALGLLEALAIITGFALFGRVLGMRDTVQNS